MEGWGILGTWAADCSAPPGRDNTFYTYVRRGDRVFLDRDGQGFKDSSPITRAEVLPDGMIEYRVDFGRGPKKDRSNVFINTFAKGPEGRIRIFFNRSEAGEVTVREGRLLPGGVETSWRERCRPGRIVSSGNAAD